MVIDMHIVIGILALLLLVVVIDLFFLRRKLKKILHAGTDENIGDSITSINAHITDLDTFRKDMETYLTGIEKRMRRSYQATETVRFNAFRGDGIGGNQSFATVFLNQDGDGTLISSLYSRERVSVFSKPITQFKSEIELSEEEDRALSLAKAKITGR